MPTLDFKGKADVYGHHLVVPWRPLVPHPDLCIGAGDIDDNLVICGDNLHALKALLPRYAGRVKCVYIDPPYNTGNEGWVYNDNGNSAALQHWLTENIPVDGEDLQRHDKWLTMMWPRLQLLRLLLCDDGVIFVSIDDNEVHHLRMMMDEIFGEDNFVNSFVWVNNLKGRQISTVGAAGTHEHILVYAADVAQVHRFEGSVRLFKQMMPTTYKNRDYETHTDDIGEYVLKNELHNTNSRFNELTSPTLVFDIYYHPDTGNVRCEDVSDKHLHAGYVKISPKMNNRHECRFHAWRWSRQKVISESHNLEFVEASDGRMRIYTKIREYDRTAAKDLITDISTSDGRRDLEEILGTAVFDYPKPVTLIKFLVSLCETDAIVLDSFAGSGTTGQAVLALNKADGGNRRFIMVECEDYADEVTAERVRRVIAGVSEARDHSLREGLGGTFTYCTLGERTSGDGMLTGESLPSYDDLAAWLVHSATGLSVGPGDLASREEHGLIYSSDSTDYYLIYEPDVEWLQSNESVLTAPRAEAISAVCRERGSTAVVFATARYIAQDDLKDMGVMFAQLPFAVAQIDES